MNYAKLKVISSTGPLPMWNQFKNNEQVLIRYESGSYAIGRVMEMVNIHKAGPVSLWSLVWSGVKGKHVDVLGGQGCTCERHSDSCRSRASREKRWLSVRKCKIHGTEVDSIVVNSILAIKAARTSRGLSKSRPKGGWMPKMLDVARTAKAAQAQAQAAPGTTP